MQCPREQDALIPQPRGDLPKLCAAVTAVVTIGCKLLFSPEKLLGWIAIAVLMLTVGPLLHGLCLLAEELIYHSNTRYRGQGMLSHMLPACGLGGKTLLAAGVASLMLYLAGHHLPHKCNIWELLVLVFVLYPLLKVSGVLIEDEYLEQSIAGFCATHQLNNTSWGRGSRKLLILIPLNANISHKLEDEDENIQFYDNLPNNEIDRAGVRGRVYKHSVYRIMDENRKVCKHKVTQGLFLIICFSILENISVLCIQRV
uniref:Uncharacterized protein n=1 Tax=Neolamprologus brichardi TaxID=32507 RepID=A0A3Q4IAV0_NEOBR